MEEYIGSWHGPDPLRVSDAGKFFRVFMQCYEKITEIDTSDESLIMAHIYMCEFVAYNESFIFDPSVPHNFCSMLMIIINGTMANLNYYTFNHRRIADRYRHIVEILTPILLRGINNNIM